MGGGKMVVMLVAISLLFCQYTAMGKETLDQNKIVQMYEQGLSTVKISRELECSKAGVRGALLRAGVALRTGNKRSIKDRIGFVPTKEWMLEVMPHFDSASAAARHYKIPYSSFIDYLEKFNIPRERWKGGPRVHGRRQEIPIEEAVKLSNDGVTYEELSRLYCVSYGVICRRMKDVGHEAPWRRTKDLRFSTHSTKKRKVFQELNIDGCEVCGEDRTLDFAHIKPAKEGGPIEKENCLVLCPTHHRVYDSGQMTEEEFSHVLPKVRTAEALYGWTNGFYGGW